MPGVQTLEYRQADTWRGRRIGQIMNGSEKSRVIVALDYPDAQAALALVERLEPGSCRLKVGKELFTRAGPALIGKLC